MADHNKIKMALATNTQLALKHLRTSNFTAYISALAALGVDITGELGITSVKELARLQDAPSLRSSSLDEFLLTESEVQNMRRNAILFARVWSKAGSHSLLNSDGREAKYKLDMTTRRNIHFALLAIENILNNQSSKIDLPTQNSQEMEVVVNSIFEAINTYETKKQKIIRVAGKTLAALTSIAFGVLQTGVAMFFVGMLAFSPVGIPAIAGLLVGALVLGSIFSYVSYCTLRQDIPNILQQLIGKDKFLQGFREYKNKEGKTVPFSKKQMGALATFSLLFALPSAIATGAFSFTSTLSIPAILAVFGVTVASSAFFPLGIAFAVIVTAAMTMFMIRSFHSFIAEHNGNPASYLKKPFHQIGEIIDSKVDPFIHPHLNKLAKGLSYLGTGLFCAMGVVGLVISSVAGINSVTSLVMRTFNAPTAICNGIGIAVGGVISLGARLFFTVSKCSNVIVNIFKATCQKAASKIDVLGLLAGVLIDLPLSAMSWFDSFTRPPIATPVVPMPSSIKMAVVATACTTAKEAGVVVNSMFNNKNTKQTVTIAESQHAEINKTFLNPHASFVKKPETLEHYSLFKKTAPGSSNNRPEVLPVHLKLKQL